MVIRWCSTGVGRGGKLSTSCEYSVVFAEVLDSSEGITPAYMTHHMGQFIENHIGAHVLTDQSKKGDIFRNILCIQVEIDITKLLRRSLLLLFQGTKVGIDLRYEKLPITCFICGIIRHIEEQCVQFKGD